ncbi:MAG: nuclease-related domain-containing protein [Patescibacteria group bacterium]
MKLSYYQKSLSRSIICFVLVIVVGYFYYKYPFYKYLKFWWSSLAWMGGFAILALLFSKFGYQIGNRIFGKQSEDNVKKQLLKGLSGSYKILDNLVIGDRGNIDIVVIGPSGVWSIEVKSHEGNIGYDDEELTRNGCRFQEKNFLRQAWAQKKIIEETLLSELQLTLHVWPVIVFENPNAIVHFGLNKKRGVYVIGYDWLEKLIADSFPQNVLNYEKIEIIYNILNKYKENSK